MPRLFPVSFWYMPASAKLIHDKSAPGVLKQRNTVVLHITQGPTAMSAWWTFENSKRTKDGGKGRVSAHFIVDRDGSTLQTMPICDTAFHASQANASSIGIETAAIAGQLPASEEQYAALARLVAWCCDQMGAPIDRAHVRTHHEASPRDNHPLCCTGALDPDRVVREAQLYAAALPPLA